MNSENWEVLASDAVGIASASSDQRGGDLRSRASQPTNLSEMVEDAGNPDEELTPEIGDDVEEPFEPVSTSRSLKMIAADLWHQKPGAREQRDRPRSTKEIVNGLDRREYIYGWYASALALATGVIGYVHNRTASGADHKDAGVELVALLVGWACMVAGTALRRRALLGFASFLVGLELISGLAGWIGFLFLGFGFWLIARVMRKQRQDRATEKPATTTGRGSSSSSSAPKPSKRYTPPRTRSSSGRRR
jgi:hypothetical protein